MIVDAWDGDAAALWTAGDPTGSEVLARLRKLPGFGVRKAKKANKAAQKAARG